ncbi:hypothetical protein JXC34_04850 [Candidatus Woesearchaeota archaeon]|nr:hypothetical protein [Candidatus Woesearchaeota archaeon]
MVGIATAMIIVFMVIFSEIYGDNLDDKRRILAEDYGYSLQNEFIVAASTSNGYTRTFDVPETLEGFEYGVEISGASLILNYTYNILVLPIPNVEGNIVKGSNMISNINNTLCLNC